ncbi:MAG: amidohydrolase family protein [Patescibacteria group bacterium]|nr:amidohydrolase family protein [Patescibacteria group bacterium]
MANAKKVAYFDLKQHILKKIKKNGGWANCHAHLDRAFTITPETFNLYQSQLKEKWHLVDEVKKNSTVTQIYDRMAYAIEMMMAQGITAVGTFIDVDDVIEDKAIKAATKIRDRYGKDIQIKYINQVLKGVLDPKAKKWFDIGAQFVDIIGGLPGKDKGREAEHIDVLMDTAKKMGKMTHIHVDQLNTAAEKETELLVKKTIEHGMQGKVVGVHGISIAAHPKKYRMELYKKMVDAGVMMVSCPIAWIDNARTDELAPTHNAITPVDEMVPAGVTVSIGTDNICDIYLPLSDGNIWAELKLMIAACRYTDIDQLVKVATENGRKTLGIK